MDQKCVTGLVPWQRHGEQIDSYTREKIETVSGSSSLH